MSFGYSRFNSLAGLLAGTSVAAIVICQSAEAKSAKEVAKVAIPTTVQLNNPLDPQASGSGVIIAKKDKTYTVLTANHVVASQAVDEYTIRTSNGKEYPTTLVQRMQNGAGTPDLAVVTFESEEKYPVASLSNSDEATIGTGIYVSGYPLPTPAIPEREYTFLGGQVISRRQSDDRGYTLVYDMPTRRGMSGGPVFDVNGRVVGIHGEADSLSQVLNQATGQEEPGDKTGRNLGIPINTFVAMVSQSGMETVALKLDNKPADNDEAITPSRDELNSWYKDFAIGVGRRLLRRVLPF